MARFEVYISNEGFAEIDGEPVTPAPGQSLREAVLDGIQRYAQSRAAAVEAKVHDTPSMAIFLIEVSPDGSSRVLNYTEAPDNQETGPLHAAAPVSSPATAVESTRVGASGSALAPAPGTAPNAVAAPTALSAPTAGVTAAPTDARTSTSALNSASTSAAAPAALSAAATAAVAAAPDLPAELAEQVSHINALAAVGRLDEAFAEATALRESLTGSTSSRHPYAMEALALEAFLAHLRGEHRLATVLALAVARNRCGAGDGRAPAEVARAAAAWQWLDDDRAAVIHGRELLHMWDRLYRRGLLPPDQTELAERVRRRVDVLAAYV